MSQIKLRKRESIVGWDTAARFQVPTEADFDRQNTDWIEAQGCEKIAKALIGTRKCFGSIRGARIKYLWKRKASDTPKMVLGKCQRPTGLLRHFSDCEFIIWFAANNCLKLGLDNWQMEALVFHELKHADMSELEPVLNPHDWEGFADEIRYYGLWKNDIKPIAEAIQTLLQFPFDAPTQPEPDAKRPNVQ